jgi:V8-like Glu-specific endopeptidase
MHEGGQAIVGAVQNGSEPVVDALAIPEFYSFRKQQERSVMPNRSLTPISLLMLGVALLATPGFAADSIPSNKGSGQPPVNRAAPAALPGKVAPKPALKIDASALSRGPLALDPAAAAASMATVTRSSDGSVTETPASEGLRAILESEIKASNPSMSTDRVVGPTDDRAQVTDSNAFPAYTVGWLWSQDQKGNWSTCTASLIGPKTVITAAHCVYDHETGGWATDIRFLPGVTDAASAPFGEFEWNSANILKGFIDNYDGTNYGSVLPWDLAEIELVDNAGEQLGWLGVKVDTAADFKATILGYPGDKPDGTMWQTSCDVPTANFGDQVFWHTCNTAPGSSGSAMWEDDGKGNLSIRGINVADDGKVNYGVRIIDSYFQFLVDNYK